MDTLALACAIPVLDVQLQFSQQFRRMMQHSLIGLQQPCFRIALSWIRSVLTEPRIPLRRRGCKYIRNARGEHALLDAFCTCGRGDWNKPWTHVDTFGSKTWVARRILTPLFFFNIVLHYIIFTMLRPNHCFGLRSYMRMGHGSQMVGLHVVCSRFQKCNSGYWLPNPVSKSFFRSQMYQMKCVHQKESKTYWCHRVHNSVFFGLRPNSGCPSACEPWTHTVDTNDFEQRGRQWRVHIMYSCIRGPPPTSCLPGRTLRVVFLLVCRFVYVQRSKTNNTTTVPVFFSPSPVLSLSLKFVKHSLIKQVPMETCHIEICTVNPNF